MWEVYVIIAAYIILMAVIGVVSSKKANNLTAFTVGGRNAGAWFSAFAYGTSYFSAVIFIGYAGRNGMTFGAWAVLIGLGNALIGTFLAWKILAKRTRIVTRKFKLKTMPDYFSHRYQSPAMKTFAAVIIFLFMLPYSASVYTGLSYLFETILGIDYTVVMIVMAVISAVYLTLGGYIATLFADFFQGIVILIGVALLFVFLMNSPEIGGIGEGISRLMETTREHINLMDFSDNVNVLTLVGLIVLTSLGTWGLPQMVQKFYAIKDDGAVKRGMVISTLFAVVVSVGAYFFGSMSRVFFENGGDSANFMQNGSITNYDAIIPEFFSQGLPQFMVGLIVVLIFAASISTLSSIVLTSSTSLSMDLIRDTFFKKLSKNTTLLITRALCIVFIILSVIIASTKSPIQTLMSLSWGTVAGSFLAPYLLGLFYKKTTKAGAWSGMVTGLAVSVILSFVFNFSASMSPVCGMCAMAASIAVTFVVSQFTKQFEPEFIESIMALDSDDTQIQQ